MGKRATEKTEGSLGSPKVLPFSLVLKRAIKFSFGTNREFAVKLRVTEGRVSQLISPLEVISPQTLQHILSGFDDLGTQEELHRAWITTFAPSPFSMNSARSESQVRGLLSSSLTLKASGRAKHLFSSFEDVLSSELDSFLRFQVMEEAVGLALYLGRPSRALLLTESLLSDAKEQCEIGWIGKAMYLRATASRGLLRPSSRALVSWHEEAMLFARSHSHASKMCSEIVETLERDRVLTLIALGERKAIDPSILDDAEKRLETSIERTDDIGNRLLSLEVKVRLLLFSGRTFEAEEVLEEARETKGATPIDYSAKEHISQARLHIARGEVEEAKLILEAALDDCLLVENMHHAGRIEGLLANLLVARLL
jgi:hypothetical protein